MSKKQSHTKGLSNPLAIASIAQSDAGQKAVGQGVNALKYLLMIGGSVVALRYGWNQFKKLRADAYAREHVGNPNLIAAAVIYESFTRIGFPSSSVLSYLIPEIGISTDETALNRIASKIKNVKDVSDAYSILFDRNLFKDVQKGLSTTELQTFWNIIGSPDQNLDQETLYPIGSTLYSSSKSQIIVNKAIKENDIWRGTAELYDTFLFGEQVGTVIANGIWQYPDGVKEHYYIVEDCFLGYFSCDTGVVVQGQITNHAVV